MAFNSLNTSSKPTATNSKAAWIASIIPNSEDLAVPVALFSAGAVCSLFIASRVKSIYHQNFVIPYTLKGAFRDSPLHIRNAYRIIDNCLLSEVHVDNSKVIINSGVIHKLHVNGSSTIILNGGLIKGELVIVGKESRVLIKGDSIVEANIFTVDPQCIQQAEGLLRGTIRRIEVGIQDGMECIMIKSPSKTSVQISHPSTPTRTRSIHSDRNMMHYQSPQIHPQQMQQPRYPMLPPRASSHNSRASSVSNQQMHAQSISNQPMQQFQTLQTPSSRGTSVHNEIIQDWNQTPNYGNAAPRRQLSRFD